MELKTARGRLLLFILLLIAFPAVNRYCNIIRSTPLNNDWPAWGSPEFSLQNFWDGTYQAKMNDNLNDSIGFRAELIRLNNQLDFNIFRKLNARGIILGGHNNLFYSDYIEAYCGADYAGDNYPVNLMAKLKKVQDTLEKMGKLFVYVHAASKASYAPEDIPGDIACNSNGKTNLKNFKRIADSLNIHQIDFNSWYASLKGKTPHPLFNTQGIHWSAYGALYAVDSLISYFEHRKGIRMLHPRWTEIDRTVKARRGEDDMEMLLNLIYPIDTAEYWYPRWHYDDCDGCTKPNVIYIGDSFNWTLMHDGIMNSDSSAQFWYYFIDVFAKDTVQPTLSYNMPSYNWLHITYDMPSYKWQQEIQKADIIVLMYTASSLVKRSATFIEAAYNYYYPVK